MRTLLIVLVASAYASSALAERYPLFQKGAWSVDLVEVGESVWCEARTTNGRGQTFDLSAFSDSSLALYVWDDSWNISERPVTFLVDIDYSRWTLSGQAKGQSVSIYFSEPEKTIEFFGQLRNGNAVAVMNEDERRLAVFSLHGSSAAISSLMECWDRIMPEEGPINPQDPFVTSSDPFL